MPYTIKERRQAMLDGTLKDIKAGDIVFYFYHHMVQQWKEKQSFETAYYIRSESNEYFGAYDILKKFPQSAINYNVDTCFYMAWDEFRRRFLDPYEDQKKIENGDVL